MKSKPLAEKEITGLRKLEVPSNKPVKLPSETRNPSLDEITIEEGDYVYVSGNRDDIIKFVRFAGSDKILAEKGEQANESGLQRDSSSDKRSPQRQNPSETREKK